jgi:hypothetical protein
METTPKKKLVPESATRPTISIKNALNIQKEVPKKAAVNGVLKRGNTYKFTKYKHEEIIDMLKKVQVKTGLNNKKFSVALGYCDTAFRQWCSGARFSRPSFLKVMENAYKLNEQAKIVEQKQLSLPITEHTQHAELKFTKSTPLEYYEKNIPIDILIKLVKRAGYKVYKRIENWEEI